MSRILDITVLLLLTIVLIVGVYQFYFLTQNHMIKPARSLRLRADDWLGFKPAWVFIYSGLYYPVIALTIFTVPDMRHYNYMAVSYFLLLMMQMACFRYFPVATPPEWRDFGAHEGGHSLRFMRVVQRYDQPSNCFPSMHVSVATLTALHLVHNAPEWGQWPWLFPLLIAISALYTKQHFMLDLPPGALLGWLAFWVYQRIPI